MDRIATSRPILAILLESILQEPSERKVQQSISPGHCAELQSVTSVELPSQSSRPGWWQARALIFRPLPQELVHVDQSPHSCQPWATGRISSGERFSISCSLHIIASSSLLTQKKINTAKHVCNLSKILKQTTFGWKRQETQLINTWKSWFTLGRQVT